MRDIAIDLADYDVKTLYDETVIRQGENNASQLVITLDDEFTGYSYRLNFQLNYETPYNTQAVVPVAGIITYPLTNVVTFQKGALKIELQAYDINDTLIKSTVFVFKIIPAIAGTPITLPPEYDTFIAMGTPSITDVASTLMKRGTNKEVGITTIDFSTDPVLTQLVAGRLQWDTVYQCMVYGLKDAVGSHQIGQEFNIYAKNTGSVNLPTGMPVYIDGSTGELLSIGRATNNGTETQSRVIGVAGGAGIDINGTGYVLTYGILHNINTNAFNQGDELWLGVNGVLTNVKPITPAYIIFVGWVIKKAGSGKIFINPKYMVT